MQVEEESPKQYVDIARAPDKEMRPDRPVPPGCGQDGRLLRYPPRPYRHMAFVGCLVYGPSWPQPSTSLVMKQVLPTHRHAQAASNVSASASHASILSRWDSCIASSASRTEPSSRCGSASPILRATHCCPRLRKRSRGSRPCTASALARKSPVAAL